MLGSQYICTKCGEKCTIKSLCACITHGTEDKQIAIWNEEKQCYEVKGLFEICPPVNINAPNCPEAKDVIVRDTAGDTQVMPLEVNTATDFHMRQSKRAYFMFGTAYTGGFAFFASFQPFVTTRRSVPLTPDLRCQNFNAYLVQAGFGLTGGDPKDGPELRGGMFTALPAPLGTIGRARFNGSENHGDIRASQRIVYNVNNNYTFEAEMDTLATTGVPQLTIDVHYQGVFTSSVRRIFKCAEGNANQHNSSNDNQ